jgi:tetratricopeptide (TPR) repeat protein
MAAQDAARVKAYEGKEEIPSYKRGPDETSPIFYTGRGVQGAAGHIYPYPAQLSLGDKLSTETYDMVYLENEYLKVTILPSFGGKLFSAIDKTNGHELFHRNSTVKPDLIGSLGAWISGGIEWCFPHHHRTSTLLPADYRIVENSDGSATVWVGETERDLGLRGVIGITLYPGRSYIETTYYLNNSKDVTKNFLFWANVAVTANKDFRTFWPPSQEIGVFHSNTSFVHWPISHETYRGVDYTSGVDLTWWKNHPDPISFFFWQGKEGFIGGYDYAQKAGTVHVGDVYNNRTSKLWQFGPGLQGQNARKKLTDDGKAYVELMTGTFSNNQPDYSWFFPHSVKGALNYWYPIRDLEIVKNANIDASVALNMKDAKNVFYGFNTTKKYSNAKAVLKYDNQEVASKIINIDPATPFTATYSSKQAIDEYKLSAELKDEKGNILVSYSPYKLQHPPLPPAQDEIKLPHEIESTEDLYLTGRFIEQFARPGMNADDYYLKALEKSPDDYRVNIEMGIRRVNQWRYAEAEKYLQKAANKLKVEYLQPKEGELFYYLGLAQKWMGKEKEAYNSFFRATWYYEWYSASYYQLALLESKSGNYPKACEFAANAYSTNNNDGSINIVYAALLRKNNRAPEAVALMNRLLAKDPINFAAIYEKELLEGRSGSMSEWHKNMQDPDNNYIDIAVFYLNAGLWDDAIRILSSLKTPKNPLTCYYLAWLYEQTGQSNKVQSTLASATKLSIDYCFPFRQETEAVLKYAAQKDPSNATVHYLLGNLLYDRRPDDAIHSWEHAKTIKNDFPIVLRNLAFGSFHQNKDVEKAINYMKQAIAANPSQPIWYSELEGYYDLSKADFKECLAIMEKNIETVKKDITAPQSLVKLYNLNGEYDKAINLLRDHHFRTWEGGREIHQYYVDAHTLKAITEMANNRNESAVEQLNLALLYPENLEVGKPLNDDRNAMIYYLMGQAYDKMNNKRKAKDCYKKSTEARNALQFGDLIYFQAQSQKALGNSDESAKLCNSLIERGQSIIARRSTGPGIGVETASMQSKMLANGYYLQALGNLGLGNTAKSKELLKETLKLYPNHLWAKYFAK